MKLFVWGTGRIVGKVIGVHVKEENVAGFIDNNCTKRLYMDKPVFRPYEMIGMEYDAILVANLYRKSIYEQCIELGIDLKKVIFLYNNCELVDVNQNYDFIINILGEVYAEAIRTRYHVVRGTEVYGKRYQCTIYGGGYMETDYVRMETFELVLKELRKRDVEGNVAEAGVFRGEFAQYINDAFPDKKLYLFDTFDGFNANEVLDEMKNGNCTKTFVEAYKNTNIQQVLDRMPHLETLIIKQGYFPDSLQGLEDKFCFVSLDMDFEESIYQGLVYFYPRLARGGYIFVHDYNSSLRGVEKAVDKYENNFDVMLHKVPICDANGSLVITK